MEITKEWIEKMYAEHKSFNRIAQLYDLDSKKLARKYRDFFYEKNLQRLDEIKQIFFETSSINATSKKTGIGRSSITMILTKNGVDVDAIVSMRDDKIIKDLRNGVSFTYLQQKYNICFDTMKKLRFIAFPELNAKKQKEPVLNREFKEVRNEDVFAIVTEEDGRVFHFSRNQYNTFCNTVKFNPNRKTKFVCQKK